MLAKEYVKKRAIFEYLVCLLKGEKKMKASINVVNVIYNSNSKLTATWIQQIAKYQCINNVLSSFRQRKHQKISRIIDDEDIADMCHKWIRNNESHITPHQFKEFVQDILLLKTGINKNVISVSTARQWLNILGYHYQ